MINIGIVGYGNLGRGVEANLKNAPDMNLVGIFSRRNPDTLDTEAKAYHIDDILNFKDKIDVLILCGGSRSDIPEQGPALAEHFNTVDSYDNHSQIPNYFESIDTVAKAHKYVSIIATGWDPGLFSLNRLIGEAILPKGDTYTFWGEGLSQGHGDAVRRVEGVKDGVQYTIPNTELIDQIHAGETVEYTSKSAHNRDVYVVLEEGADAEKVKNDIVTMPDYFEGYQTEVTFITEEELHANHAGLPHGGRVIRSGETSPDMQQVYEYGLNLGSNPEFTAAVNVAYARAAYKLHQEGLSGAQTVFDIAPKYLSPKSAADLRKELL
ncbi:diaminopimelate dehydrogenase [Aerococcaceae bacterium INB8]|uniref:Meso-diaminopimelate D-dehydrogenase n=1 Tax=Ruoffia halotolerans TaxID=2748684 RepID=A0A839A5E8_9LACT|nr:diaminopimelate dehydrogenase [Ruoffia halotolerans]MBA5729466.1 diaminopimelate dehydrogenase [Ruoffia halotolerans]